MLVNIRTCRNNEWKHSSWITLNHHFFPVDCGQPASPENGAIIPYSSTITGASVTFICNPGYTPANHTNISKCSYPGKWVPPPRCLRSMYTYTKYYTLLTSMYRHRWSLDSEGMGTSRRSWNCCDTKLEQYHYHGKAQFWQKLPTYSTCCTLKSLLCKCVSLAKQTLSQKDNLIKLLRTFNHKQLSLGIYIELEKIANHFYPT